MSRSVVPALVMAALIATPPPALAQQSDASPARVQSRTEAPEPHRPAGPLHFLGLFPLGDARFVDAASVEVADGHAGAWLLTVNGRVRQVAEGDIRWTWSRLDIDCAGHAWETLEYDAYDTAGTWLAGFSGPALESNPVDTPAEESIQAYVCDGTRPPVFQSVPDQATAVAGVMQAFVNQ